MVKCYVWGMLLHQCETQTMGKMERITSADIMSNEDILIRIKETEYVLIQSWRRREPTWGHVMRGKKY